MKALYAELHPFLNESYKKEGKEKLKEIENCVTKKDENTTTYTTNIFDLAFSFECWMRDNLNDKGLLMAKKDEDDGL